MSSPLTHKMPRNIAYRFIFSVGNKLFRLFLTNEIAEENLLFWEAVEELKKMKAEKRMQKLSRSIYDDFISVYSPREVSLVAIWIVELDLCREIQNSALDGNRTSRVPNENSTTEPPMPAT